MNLTEKSETITNGAITTENLCVARIASIIGQVMRGIPIAVIVTA